MYSTVLLFKSKGYRWRKEWQPSPVFLPGESHGQRSLVDYSPWDCKESDTTEWLTQKQQKDTGYFPGASVVKNSPAMQETCRRLGFNPWVGKIPWRRKRQPTPVFLPGKSHGQRRLVGYSPWSHKRVGYDLATKQQQRIQGSKKQRMQGSIRGSRDITWPKHTRTFALSTRQRTEPLA